MENGAMIRAAIVGLGRWGRVLTGSVAGKSDAIRFVSAYTRNAAAAADFCRANDIVLADSYAAILGDPQIDAVALATPHSQHAAQAMAAVAAGKHVFVEKPLTLDLASARRVADAAHAAGVVLAVGLSRRFHPSVAALRARAQAGRLGSIVAMIGQHTTSTAQFIAPGNWRAAADEAPGGAFTAVGVHVLDHMIELAGRVRDVRCITARAHPGPTDDTTTAMLRFEGGASGLIFCSVATPTNFTFTVYGSAALAEISRPDLSHLRFAAAATSAPSGAVPAAPDEILQFPGCEISHAALTAFAEAIRDGTPFPVPIDDVLHGMAVFEAIVESADRGAIVAVAH
jgi:predicted dehydrogenase